MGVGGQGKKPRTRAALFSIGVSESQDHALAAAAHRVDDKVLYGRIQKRMTLGHLDQRSGPSRATEVSRAIE